MQTIFHISFYKFVQLDKTQEIIRDLHRISSHLLGSILVAPEGINGVLSGTRKALDDFQHRLINEACFHNLFHDMPFKHTPCKTQPFKKLKIHLKKEIVFIGIPGIHVTDQPASFVSPTDWDDLISQNDVLVIDNRNGFEYRLGHFKNAFNPNVNNFRDFPKFVQEHALSWQQQGKKVAMYCTGGIRCEKAAVWMHDLGLEVYQLQGGILNYLQTVKQSDKSWHGECFVFDNRIALDIHLQETRTELEQIYSSHPDEAWRLERARRLRCALDD